MDDNAWHVICGFKQESRVLAGVIADQLGVSTSLGVLKPFRVWVGGDFDWPNRPEVRIVFLTIRQAVDGGPVTSAPVESDDAKSAATKLNGLFEVWEGMKDAIVYIEADDKFTDRLWRDDERTMRILRNICLLQISGRFPDWLDPPDVEPESEMEPEPEPKPESPDWPGIDRPTRF